MKNSLANRSCFAKCQGTRILASWRIMAAKLALLVPLLLSSVPVSAQKANAAQPVHRYKRQNLDERVELLARYLDLSEGQRSTLKIILVERQQEILKMRHAPSQGEVLQMDRFQAIEDEIAKRIRALLTEEQRKKYDPLGMQRSTSATQNVSVTDWLSKTGSR